MMCVEMSKSSKSNSNFVGSIGFFRLHTFLHFDHGSTTTCLSEGTGGVGRLCVEDGLVGMKRSAWLT